jgi:hypothetical protein
MRIWILALLASGACVVDGGPADTRSQTDSLTLGTCIDSTLNWGSDEHTLGRLGPAEDFAARGPTDAAVRTDGTILLLDPVNRRVASLSTDGTLSTVASVPEHADDLAVGDDGTIAVHSALSSEVWLYNSDGRQAGSIKIPRVLRNVVDISVRGSRQIVAHTAFQESYLLGSPSAVADLPSVLANKREGAFMTGERSGVQSLIQRGAAVARIATVSNIVGAKPRYRDVFLGTDVDAALTVGSSHGSACFRLERVDRDTSIVHVSRQIRCVDLESGEVIAEQTLESPGLYVPRHEVIFENERLVSLIPNDAAMTVRNCEVKR